MNFSKKQYGHWLEDIVNRHKPDKTLNSESPLSADKVSRVDDFKVNQTPMNMRFIVVGDMHKNYPNTSSTCVEGVDKRTGPPVKPVAYNDRFKLLLDNLKREKEDNGLDFVVFNGDIIHSTYNDKIPPLQGVKDSVHNKVGVPLYTTYGNHDRATDEQWQHVFGHKRNHYFSVGDFGFIILNTSDTNGNRDICMGENFLANALNELSNKKGVFVFAHIPRYSGIRPGNSYDSPACKGILDLFKKHQNIVGVIHSHFHEESREFRKDGVNYWFTGHFAHYGLNYYGYRVVEVDTNDHVHTNICDVTNAEYRDVRGIIHT